MVTRNIVIIIVFFIVIAGALFLLNNWKTKCIVIENNEKIQDTIKSIINSQFNLKNRPVVNYLEEKKSSKGNYLFNEDQINAINSYIAFNTSKVDEALNESKDEISRDIDRLNTWMTLWLSIIAIIGIFIPIALNVYSSKDLEKNLKKVETKANLAQDLATKAEASLTTSLPKITKVSEAANLLATNALIKTQQLEILMQLLDSLSKLKLLDFLRIHHTKLTKDEYLKLYFIKIKNGVTNCKASNISPFSNQILKEVLIDFSITLYQLNIFIKPDRDVLKTTLSTLILSLNELTNCTENTLELSYDGVISNLQELVSKMEIKAA